MRSYRPLLLLFILLIFIPFLTHYYMSRVFSNGSESLSSSGYGNRDGFERRMVRQIYSLNDMEALEKYTDLRFRVKEMLRIRGSVSNELKSLESRRQKLHSEISLLSSKLDEMKLQLSKKQMELRRVHVSLEQAKYSQIEANMKNSPFIARPLSLISNTDFELSEQLTTTFRNHSHDSQRKCIMDDCFNYSRCSLLSGFSVYMYEPDDGTAIQGSRDISRRLKLSFMETLKSSVHLTTDPSVACTYLVILFNHRSASSAVSSYLHNLPYWNRGYNHLVLNLIPNYDLIFHNVLTDKAIIAQDTFYTNSFRSNYDINIPSWSFIGDQTLPPLCPAKRKYLASFRADNSFTNHSYYSKISAVLKMIVNESRDDLFAFDTNCTIDCSNSRDILQESTFGLIVANELHVSNQVLSENLVAVINAGAVPVLIAGSETMLPFQEVIDWNLAVVRVPIARITELHYLLKSFMDNDILAMRRQARLFYERYLNSPSAIINTALAIIRQKRLQIPAPPVPEVPTAYLFNNSFPMKYFDPVESFINPESVEPDENLGPLEPPFTTLQHQRNYSLTLTRAYELWNSFRLNPFYLYPNTPFDPVLPSDAKFIGSSFGFRPIGGGVGGAGKEFSESLGGNYPREQFTIVVLTYEREAVLIDSLIRLKGLPHLNKIVVIWNNPERLPSADLKWPDVGVPLQVIKSDVNSLNNRFKPYDTIETEAVLSMDDDAHLRHDEIIFGFRVWRESRDRIVGFPGRYHAWEASHNAWLYNSNYSCELSMVLTGAAFFHKYYAYLYTYSMPSSIRDKVDEYMNCEDIAMNFLVSHITRKPPLKVTSRWTFRCPDCPVSLSEDDSHFQERHRCMNFFTRIYGYNPLLHTQFRADSVLFKTRIPHDKQKCFKFI